MSNSFDEDCNRCCLKTHRTDNKKESGYITHEEVKQHIKKKDIPKIQPYAISGLLYETCEEPKNIGKNDRGIQEVHYYYTISPVTTFCSPERKVNKDTTLPNVQAFSFLSVQDESQRTESAFKHLNAKSRLTYSFKEKSDDNDTLYKYARVPCGMLAADLLFDTVTEEETYFGNFNSKNKIVYYTEEELDSNILNNEQKLSFEKLDTSFSNDYNW